MKTKIWFVNMSIGSRDFPSWNSDQLLYYHCTMENNFEFGVIATTISTLNVWRNLKAGAMRVSRAKIRKICCVCVYVLFQSLLYYRPNGQLIKIKKKNKKKHKLLSSIWARKANMKFIIIITTTWYKN